MMLPAVVPNLHQMIPGLCPPRLDIRPLEACWIPAALEFAAFGGFIAMCIGLMAEFS